MYSKKPNGQQSLEILSRVPNTQRPVFDKKVATSSQYDLSETLIKRVEYKCFRKIKTTILKELQNHKIK